MKNIEKMRRAKGMTQEELATKIGVDRTSVTKWETGAAMPSSAKLPMIAAALGCEISELYDSAGPAA